MTNGEKIKEIFPNSKIITQYDNQFGDRFMVFTLNNEDMQVNIDWWNAEYKESTTKDDLGVDCVARQDVERYIEGFVNEYTPKEELEFINLELDGLKHIPSVTPQLSSELAKNSQKLEKDFGELDCISREATVKRLCNLAEFLNEHKENSGAPYIVAALFIQDNKTEFPSVIPIRPKGHWIDTNYHQYYNDGDIETTELKCSCCNEEVEWDIELLHKPYFCENCGAKMETEDI